MSEKENDTTKTETPEQSSAPDGGGGKEDLVTRATSVATEVGDALADAGKKLMAEFRELGAKPGQTDENLGAELQDKLRVLGKDLAGWLDNAAAKTGQTVKRVTHDVRAGMAEVIDPDKKKREEAASESKDSGGSGDV